MKRLSFVFFLFVYAVTMNAQGIGGHRGGAKYAANRGDLQIGISGAYLRPDYGPGVGTMLTPYAALDFRRSYVGLEVDGNFVLADKSDAKPNSVTFGLRLGADVGNARVYIKPAIGVGYFSGATMFPSSSSQVYKVYSIGGGVDYQLLEHVNLRAFGTYQVWPNFDGNTTSTYDHGGSLTPIFAGLGVAYRF